MAAVELDADNAPYMPSAPRGGSASAPKCPYLDTINRALLDFDMPKICSISLTPSHVYACLVCGKFFAGRGPGTHAHTHSVQALHHVFINLADGRVWCLPDMYEVHDASLRDIKYALMPTFADVDVAAVDTNTRLSRDVAGASYLPGYIGLNNLTRTDGINALVHALAHVSIVRDFFLRTSTHAHVRSPLVHAFGALVRRIWSPAAFKSTAAPVEFVQAVDVASGGRFKAGTGVDVCEAMTWLVNALHDGLTEEDVAHRAVADAAAADVALSTSLAAAPRKRARVESGKRTRSGRGRVITEAFQGEIEVEIVSSELQEAEAAEHAATDAASQGATSSAAAPSHTHTHTHTHTHARDGGATSASAASAAPPRPSKQRLPFLFLSLDLPPAPLFKDEEGGLVITQVPLATLLRKYDGEFVTDSLRGQYRERKRYRITRLPPFLMLSVRRFTRNAWFTEKNPTIIAFPVRGVDMRAYRAKEQDAEIAWPSVEALETASVSELTALWRRLREGGHLHSHTHTHTQTPLEKPELLRAVRDGVTAAAAASERLGKYDLIANIVHDSPPDTGGSVRSGAQDALVHGSYRVHLLHDAAQAWYEIADLRVSDILPQMIGVSETTLLIFRRQALRA